MNAWVPVTNQSETWTGHNPDKRVFSPTVFSHEFYNGERVFSMGSAAGIWDDTVNQPEVWTVV